MIKLIKYLFFRIFCVCLLLIGFGQALEVELHYPKDIKVVCITIYGTSHFKVKHVKEIDECR